MYEYNTNHFIISLAFNSILLFCLFAPNIVYLLHKNHFKWREKDEITKETKRIKKNYWIEFMPLNNKYVAVYNKKYIFKVSGYFTLHDTPSHFYMYSTKEQAETFLKLYLEWKGKDIVKMEANI